MADAILKNTKVALMAEVTEGTHVLPAAAGDFIGVLEDNVNELITPAKEVLERAQLTATMDKDVSRSGIKSVNGTVGVEYKAGVAGAVPEYGVLVKSALGTSDDAYPEENTTLLAAAITLANEIRTDIISHFANATRHTTGQQSTSGIAAAASTQATLITLTNSLTTLYVAHNADAVLASSWQYHDAQATAEALAASTTVTTLSGAVTRLTDIKTKYNLHEALTTGHNSAGTVTGDEVAAASVAVTNVSGTGHTTDTINFSDTTAFSVGDIVAVKGTGGGIIHVSPIESIVANTSITLLVAKGTAFADNCVVDKMYDYRAASSGHSSFSLTRYTEDAIRDTAAGNKVTSMAIENWTVGQIPTISFGYEGMAYTRTLNAPAYTPSIDTSLPVIALNACIYKDGVSVAINELTVSLENTLGWKSSTCSSNGRIGSRVTERALTGTFNPYIDTTSIANFTAWEDDDTFSLFYWTGNPTATAGEYAEIVAGYIPKCQLTERGQSDADGLLQEALTFTARYDSALPLMVMAYK